MRIITGTARGTKLNTLEGESTRPTSDRVKEAVFSMLQFDIEGRAVLDLFAGSGQMGLEALSRGAARATLIDSNREAAEIIIENAKKTHLFKQCRVTATDYASFIRGAQGKETFDLIFLDPPYNTDLLPNALRLLASAKLCAYGAYLICETDCDIPVKASRARKDEELTAEYVRRDVFGEDEALMEKYEVVKSILYGRTRITVLHPVMEEADA
ncbi:MAG: 16S rRNA (guanine(966)-N(2))-methyltransferase RsmD, partial [Clostridia bacterium]|nr:16S rRNA (guanine(966)-N(2))-methyltransferase RsmD [Clostridia bacterium]